MILKPSEKLLDAIKKYQSGDQSAFDTIYYESIKYVSKSVLNVLNRTAPEASDDLQQDIIQDTYLTIASKLDTLKEPEAFLQWAGQIATRHAQRTWNKDVHRHQMEHPEDDMLYELVDEEFIPEDILYNKEKQKLIRQMLDELPTNQYLCVVEYFYNGLKEKEVAEKLGMPVNTVKTNLSRAKKKLKDIVQSTEKKQGIRLYSMSWLLILLFWEDIKAMAVPAVANTAVLEAVHAQTAAEVTGTVTAVAAESVGTAAAGAGIAAKIGAAILAAVVTVGGIIGGAKLLNNDQTEPTVQMQGTSVPQMSETILPTDAPVQKYAVSYTLLSISGRLLDTHTVIAKDQTTSSTTEYTLDTAESSIELPNGHYELTFVAKGQQEKSVEVTIADGGQQLGVVLMYGQTPASQSFTPEVIERMEQVLQVLPAPPMDGDTDYLYRVSKQGRDADYDFALPLIWNGAMMGGLFGVDKTLINEDDTAYPCYEYGFSINESIQFAEGILGKLHPSLHNDGGWRNTFNSDETNFYMEAAAVPIPEIEIRAIEQLDVDTIRVYAVSHGEDLTDLQYETLSVICTMYRNEKSFMGWSILDLCHCKSDVCDVSSLPERSATGLESIPVDSAYQIPLASYLELKFERLNRMLGYTALADVGIWNKQSVMEWSGFLTKAEIEEALADIAPSNITVPVDSATAKYDVLRFMAWEQESVLNVAWKEEYGEGVYYYSEADAEKIIRSVYGEYETIYSYIFSKGYDMWVSDGMINQPSTIPHTFEPLPIVIREIKEINENTVQICGTFVETQNGLVIGDTLDYVYTATRNAEGYIGFTLTDVSYSLSEKQFEKGTVPDLVQDHLVYEALEDEKWQNTLMEYFL